ncbi:MAG: hypothetical protein ACI9EB_000870 [Pseudomonas sp.]|jgi:hypothetical protein
MNICSSICKAWTLRGGNISKVEFQANADKRFQTMDSNGEGLISPKEHSQMQQKYQQQMQHCMDMDGGNCS